MQWIAICGRWQIQLKQAPAAPLLANNIRVRIRVAGLCGGDVRNLAQGLERPFGHEYVGIVSDVGCMASGMRGCQVVGMNSVACNSCKPCLSLVPRECESRWLLNAPSVATSIVVPRNTVYRCELPPRLAVLVEPLAATISNFRALASPETLHPGSVFGRGPMAWLAHKYLEVMQASRLTPRYCDDAVWVYSLSSLEEAVRHCRSRGRVVICFSPTQLCLNSELTRICRDRLLSILCAVASPNDCFSEADEMIARSPEVFEQILGVTSHLSSPSTVVRAIQENRRRGLKTTVICHASDDCGYPSP
jgi:hypothetical protein